MNPDFTAWLDGLRAQVQAVRASKDAAAKKGSDQKPDRRLDGVLPMQFEHDGRLRWADAAHRTAMWSALWQLGFYACWLLAIVAVLARRFVPDWFWVVLVGLFAVTWVMGRVYRRRERPAEQWRQEAEVVPGALVYANPALWEPGPEPASNAGFVFTFDPDLAADPDRLVDLGKRVFALEEQDEEPAPDLRELRRRGREWGEDRTEDNPHTFDRVRVPRSLCGNDQTFMTMVSLSRADLPGGVVDRRLYPLLARRDRNESADLLPASFWA